MHKMCLIVFIVYSVAAHAEIYKWIDDDGKVHYSDKKTTKSHATQLKSAPKVSQNDISQAQEKTNRINKQLADNKNAKLREEERQKAVDAKLAEKRKKCLDVMDKLDHIKHTPRLYYKDGSGQKIYYDETLRKQVNQRYQQAYDNNCNDQDFYK